MAGRTVRHHERKILQKIGRRSHKNVRTTRKAFSKIVLGQARDLVHISWATFRPIPKGGVRKKERMRIFPHGFCARNDLGAVNLWIGNETVTTLSHTPTSKDAIQSDFRRSIRTSPRTCASVKIASEGNRQPWQGDTDPLHGTSLALNPPAHNGTGRQRATGFLSDS